MIHAIYYKPELATPTRSKLLHIVEILQQSEPLSTLSHMQVSDIDCLLANTLDLLTY